MMIRKTPPSKKFNKNKIKQKWTKVIYIGIDAHKK